MPTQTLLWLADNPIPVASEWREMFSAFSPRSASTMAEGYDAISRGAIDCVLVSGEFRNAGAADILEMIHELDPAMPVIFWNPEMSAADAVRLVRAGAWHCLGYRDTLDRKSVV